MLKLVIDVSIYMQQMISADSIFRCIFFVAELMSKLMYCVVLMDWHGQKTKLSLRLHCLLIVKLAENFAEY